MCSIGGTVALTIRAYGRPFRSWRGFGHGSGRAALGVLINLVPPNRLVSGGSPTWRVSDPPHAVLWLFVLPPRRA
jgi:hypothetical protein